MLISIWNKTVELDEELVFAYQHYGHILREEDAMAMAISSNADHNSSPKQLKDAIETALSDYLCMESAMPIVIERIHEMNQI